MEYRDYKHKKSGAMMKAAHLNARQWVQTSSGEHKAEVGDYLVVDGNGKVRLCRAEGFAQLFEVEVTEARCQQGLKETEVKPVVEGVEYRGKKNGQHVTTTRPSRSKRKR